MQALIDFAKDFWQALWVAIGMWYDGLAWIISQILVILLTGVFGVVYSVVGALDLGDMGTRMAGAWAGVDPSILACVSASGVPTGLSIIGTAMLIRWVINLIPAEFTRI
jgi:hypothetical protein